jgi:phage terminase small subunit
MRRVRGQATPPTTGGRGKAQADQSWQKQENETAALLRDVSDTAALLEVSVASAAESGKSETAEIGKKRTDTNFPNGSASEHAKPDIHGMTATDAKDVPTDTPKKEPRILKHTIAKVDVELTKNRTMRRRAKPVNDRLDDKQSRFVKEYQVDMNPEQAAIRAGYDKAKAKHSGKRLLKQIKIMTAMGHERAQVMLRAETNADSVIEGLKAEALYFGEGSSHAARIGAWNSLGKHFGLFEDKSKMPVAINISIGREDSRL